MQVILQFCNPENSGLGKKCGADKNSSLDYRDRFSPKFSVSCFIKIFQLLVCLETLIVLTRNRRSKFP